MVVSKILWSAALCKPITAVCTALQKTPPEAIARHADDPRHNLSLLAPCHSSCRCAPSGMQRAAVHPARTGAARSVGVSRSLPAHAQPVKLTQSTDVVPAEGALVAQSRRTEVCPGWHKEGAHRPRHAAPRRRVAMRRGKCRDATWWSSPCFGVYRVCRRHSMCCLCIEELCSGRFLLGNLIRRSC